MSTDVKNDEWSTTTKLVATGIGAVAMALINFFWSIWWGPQKGIIAAKQLNEDGLAQNTVAEFLKSNIVFDLSILFLVAYLVWVWRKEIKEMLKAMTMSSFAGLMLISALLLSGCVPTRGANESENSSTSDILVLGTNESAFAIPATAGGLNEQTKFESVKYLEEKKVATKRIVISKSFVGGRYVADTLHVVLNREQIARQWTNSAATGTSIEDQAIRAESIESINIAFMISIGATISEKDSALYLYSFPSTKLRDGAIGGVYNAMELSRVVDGQVRQFIQTEIARECKKRTFKKILLESIDIVDAVKKRATDEFGKKGITIDYAGLGGPLEFAQRIQNAIDENAASALDVETANARSTVTAIDAKAQAEAIRLLVEAVGGDADKLGPVLEAMKWNGSRATVIINGNDRNAPVSIAIPTPSGTATVAATQVVTGTAGQ